jgi:DNA-binding CsgD family transcriptional regulator
MATLMDGKRSTDKRHALRRKEDRDNAVIGEFGRWLTDRQPQPLVLVDAQLTPYFYNHAAKNWAKHMKWVRVNRGKLEVLDTALGRKLKSAVSQWPHGDELTLHLSEGTRALDLTRLDIEALHAQVYIVTLGARGEKSTSLGLLRTTFGLTQAEADVVTRIYAGASPTKVAKDRRTTIYAVRQQLKSSYKKLKVGSQRELVKTISDWEARRRDITLPGKRT